MMVGGFVRLPEGRGSPVKRKITIGSKVKIIGGAFGGMSGLYAGMAPPRSRACSHQSPGWTAPLSRSLPAWSFRCNEAFLTADRRVGDGLRSEHLVEVGEAALRFGTIAEGRSTRLSGATRQARSGVGAHGSAGGAGWCESGDPATPRRRSRKLHPLSLNISREISTAWNSGAFAAALAMVYVGIDTMALPRLSASVKRSRPRKILSFGSMRNSPRRPGLGLPIRGRRRLCRPVRPCCTATAALPRIIEGLSRPGSSVILTSASAQEVDETARFALIKRRRFDPRLSSSHGGFCVQAWGKDPDLKKRVDSRAYTICFCQADIAPDPEAANADN